MNSRVLNDFAPRRGDTAIKASYATGVSSERSTATASDVDRLSITAVLDGEMCNEKLHIDVPFDLNYSLAGWLAQLSEEEPFSMIRR